MMFINNSKLSVKEDWIKLSKEALEEARKKKDPKERSAFINKKSDVWKNLKPELERISFGKCWYCESREKRSDRAVDHYRPKNNVHNTEHGGYWWLAFRADNFRLSCTFCNSRRKDREGGHAGGKADFFPLWDEKKRVCDEGDDSKCKHEDPLLLDPCLRSDVGLLWFTEDGRAVAKYSEKDRLHAFKRAEVSIDCYHLNEKEIKEARQGLFHDIKNLIEQGDFYFEDYLDGEPNAEKGISDTILSLEKMQERDAEFSAFVKAIIAGLRIQGREWLETV